jgi:DNA-binding NtrC family response regulator
MSRPPAPVSLPPLNRVLVIDDDLPMRTYVARVLARQGYQVETASGAREGLAKLAAFAPDLILLDVVMPEMDGFAACEQLRALPKSERTPVIFVTAVDDPATIYRIFEFGDTDYVGKPLRENELLARMRLHLELRRRTLENDERMREIMSLRDHLLTGKLNRPEVFAPLVTRDPAMFSLFQYIESIAVTSWPVLITGETGTGKELIARAIHDLSGRKQPLVAVNVAGLDDNMFADTLFGHVRGAFTGANDERAGMIEQASKGTLFLDEIGDLGPASQQKLLRLLQEREYYPLGSDIRKVTDARILVATNRPLEQMIKEQRFRQDLYYRLRTHQVHLPPLRERRKDLPLLLEHFLREAARQLGKPAPACPREVLELLGRYAFPGNVRELEALVLDAASRATGPALEVAFFRHIVEGAPAPGGEREASPESALAADLAALPERGFPTLREMNQLLIEKALARASGNQTSAARLLGISRQALNKRLKRGGATDDDE